LLRRADGQDFRELWFPGVHSDVGGGYPASEGSLWRLSFDWMLGEATGAGLVVDDRRRAAVLDGSNADNPWDDAKHESLTWKWWPAELFPKVVWRKGPGRRPELGLGRHRRFDSPIDLHHSTLRRIVGATGYAPPNLRASFLDEVRGLKDIPPTMRYTPESAAGQE
jgi:hypothetical protein